MPTAPPQGFDLYLNVEDGLEHHLPDDLLGTYCYLLGDDSKFVSAQTILVNGGRFPH